MRAGRLAKGQRIAEKLWRLRWRRFSKIIETEEDWRKKELGIMRKTRVRYSGYHYGNPRRCGQITRQEKRFLEVGDEI